jgi:hypothetical protein
MAEEALTNAELEGLQELTKVGSIKKTIPENILDRLQIELCRRSARRSCSNV